MRHYLPERDAEADSSRQDGARIKIWPGAIGNSTNTGGGSGWVRNVTYDGMHNYNNDWAIEMTQCYFAPNQTACNEHPVCSVAVHPNSADSPRLRSLSRTFCSRILTALPVERGRLILLHLSALAQMYVSFWMFLIVRFD